MAEQMAIAPALDPLRGGRQEEDVQGELNVSLAEMLHILAACEAEPDTDESALLNDEIAGAVRQATAEKLRGYQRFFSFADAHIEECKSEIERLQNRKRAIENAKNRLRRYMAGAMEAFGVRRLDAGTVVFTLMPCRPSLEITDLEKIPYAFTEERIVVDVDKAALKSALERGEQIEGAELRVGDPFVTIK